MKLDQLAEEYGGTKVVLPPRKIETLQIQQSGLVEHLPTGIFIMEDSNGKAFYAWQSEDGEIIRLDDNLV